MKQLFLLFCFLKLSLLTSGQTIQSNKIAWFGGINEKIDFANDEGDLIVSLAPRFYKQHQSKLKIKPIKVGGQTYFIKRKSRLGVQSVYTSSGKHVANIDNKGFAIHLVDEGSTYTLKPIIRLVNPNVLECFNSDGNLHSSTTWHNDRRLTIENNLNEEKNLLLIALSAHQYQELLLVERGRLTAGGFWYCI